MEYGNTLQAARKLKVNMDDLSIAFDNSFSELRYFLDLETGDVPMVTEDCQRALNRIYEEIGDDIEGPERDAAFAAALERDDLSDWQKELMPEADRVEMGFGTRFISVPGQDSRDGYRDMEEFIETVQDEQLQKRLWRAIDGRGAFRRFKDELFEHQSERERWFAFQDAQQRVRILEWLEDEGVDPIIE